MIPHNTIGAIHNQEMYTRNPTHIARDIVHDDDAVCASVVRSRRTNNLQFRSFVPDLQGAETLQIYSAVHE